MSKAQVAFEFVFLVALGFMILAVFLIFVRDHLQTASTDQQYALLKDVTQAVRGEIFLASSVTDGYERTFTVPTLLNNKNYSIGIINQNGTRYILTNTTDVEYLVEIPTVAGSLNKGNNTIRKEGVSIYLNS